MVYFNGGNKGQGLKKQTFRPHSHWASTWCEFYHLIVMNIEFTTSQSQMFSVNDALKFYSSGI